MSCLPPTFFLIKKKKKLKKKPKNTNLNFFNGILASVLF